MQGKQKLHTNSILDSKVHRAKMGPAWGLQDPGGPDVDLMNLAIRDIIVYCILNKLLVCIHVVQCYKLSVLQYWITLVIPVSGL